jgi:hypothetical protein
MNRSRISIAITLTLLLTGVSIPTTSAATKPKTAGRTSSSIPNTILNGKGAPLSTLGIDGDFYIDTRSLLIYGPKKNNKWPTPQSLQGPAGISGIDGKNGGDGKAGSTASNVAGPSGVQGAVGAKGDKGETGTAGANGPAGSNGATGSQGAQGATGATGSSGGGTPGATGAPGAAGTPGAAGVAGVSGPKGETGTVGSLGASGLKGETGTVGATGPSNVYLSTLPTWTLSSATRGTSSISTFLPKFLAGKSYVYEIYLYGVSDATTAVFTVAIIHEDSSAATFNYVATSKSNYYLEPKLRLYEFLITGVITVGLLDVAIAINVVQDSGDTSIKPLTLSGRMYSTLVGSIGNL